MTVDIAADAVTDAAGYGNAAATQLSVTTDGTAPTLEITALAQAAAVRHKTVQGTNNALLQQV